MSVDKHISEWQGAECPRCHRAGVVHVDVNKFDGSAVAYCTSAIETDFDCWCNWMLVLTPLEE